jgi:DNA-binding ferritin-like protein
MTVGTKMQQTIASCESTLANLHSFSLETQDQNAKQMFQNLANQQQQIMDNLKARMQYIESQEPQYKQQ